MSRVNLDWVEEICPHQCEQVSSIPLSAWMKQEGRGRGILYSWFFLSWDISLLLTLDMETPGILIPGLELVPSLLSLTPCTLGLKPWILGLPWFSGLRTHSEIYYRLSCFSSLFMAYLQTSWDLASIIMWAYSHYNSPLVSLSVYPISCVALGLMHTGSRILWNSFQNTQKYPDSEYPEYSGYSRTVFTPVQSDSAV